MIALLSKFPLEDGNGVVVLVGQADGQRKRKRQTGQGPMGELHNLSYH